MKLPYNNTCVVERAVRTEGSMGGFTEEYKEHLSDIKCRRSAPSASDIAMAGSRQAAVAATLYTDPEHDIAEGDRVTVDGVTYVTLEPVRPSIPAYQKLMLTTIRR